MPIPITAGITRYRLEDYKGAMPIAFFNSLNVYNHVWVYASDVG